MIRRRGGTNKLKQPKRIKSCSEHSPDISGDVLAGTSVQDAGTSDHIDLDSSGNVEIAGPSSSGHQTDSSCDFVFKRPRTPPWKTPKKGITGSGSSRLESRRIRSKLKPGKTGFPIGASLHGLSRSEKLERRSKGKSRVNAEAFAGTGESTSHYHTFLEGAGRPVYARKSFFTDENQRETGNPDSTEHVISYPRQTVTKLKFPPPRQRSASEKRSKKHDNLLDQQGVKESLEICQGFSKIKIDDWYPLFDFHHSKRNAAEVEVSTSSENGQKDNHRMDEDGTDDEWEESLVYVDLEDIPDVDSLFSSLSARRRMNPISGETENEEGPPLSHLEMKIFNLDSELPVMLLGEKYIAGHWENTCGTSLFFKKKSEDTSESENSQEVEKPKLKSIVPEPEIPYDPIFGKNYAVQDAGYELVAKSMKVLKARYFPVVNEELKGEDVIRDADDEFDYRDFQIPPVNMVREFMPSKLSYEEYLEKDVKRRRQIREKWGKSKDSICDTDAVTNPVKTEPLDHAEEYSTDTDTEDLDSILILSNEGNEPIPGTSKSANN